MRLSTETCSFVTMPQKTPSHTQPCPRFVDQWRHQIVSTAGCDLKVSSEFLIPVLGISFWPPFHWTRTTNSLFLADMQKSSLACPQERGSWWREINERGAKRNPEVRQDRRYYKVSKFRLNGSHIMLKMWKLRWIDLKLLEIKTGDGQYSEVGSWSSCALLMHRV